MGFVVVVVCVCVCVCVCFGGRRVVCFSDQSLMSSTVFAFHLIIQNPSIGFEQLSNSENYLQLPCVDLE